jgi:hypothetical protein
MDPSIPRPNDILPLHPAIIQQRQIAASLPPCPRGGYHELRSHQYGFGVAILALASGPVRKKTNKSFSVLFFIPMG